MPKFGKKMPYLGIFGLEFEKGIVIFEFNTLKLILKVKLGAKMEILHSRTRNALFESFR